MSVHEQPHESQWLRSQLEAFGCSVCSDHTTLSLPWAGRVAHSTCTAPVRGSPAMPSTELQLAGVAGTGTVLPLPHCCM